MALTRKHFIVLADELASDKLFYKSEIEFEEKYDRMVKYCKSINSNFNSDRFRLHMLSQYEIKKDELKARAGGTIWKNSSHI